MKYKVGQKVRIKSIDWYNENKDEDGTIIFSTESGDYNFIKEDTRFCGRVVTIAFEGAGHYLIAEDDRCYFWIDEMIEGLVEEETKPNIIEEAKTYWDSIKDAWICPDGYQFKDENGNVINATKIVLEKKKKEYPKTYEECCKVFGLNHYLGLSWNSYDEYSGVINHLPKRIEDIAKKLESLSKLLVCRDAYWKIAGEEMGLDKPWKPSKDKMVYSFYRHSNEIETNIFSGESETFEFPTKEMRDAFKENFDPDIEICKELL